MKIGTAIFLAFVLIACSAQGSLGTFPGLSQNVNDYYRYEQNHEWKMTYSMRTPGFRKNVPLPTYIETMRRDSHGWELKKFAVLDAKENKGKVEVTIRFTEQAPKGFVSDAATAIGKPNIKEPSEISLTQTSVWMLVDKKWYCYDAASRMHLSLNNPVAPE